MDWDDRARDLDTYNDGQESPREDDDRDDAFWAIIENVSRLTEPLEYPLMMEIIDRLIDVADRNIDVTDPAEYIKHAELPETS